MADINDPITHFKSWLSEAEKSEPNDPTAVALATADSNGMPNVRMVLLMGVDQAGFVFYTNFESATGYELVANPQAALCFHWKSLRRQVRVQGQIQVVTDQEADDYFASRAKDSQIGAWASQQSRVIKSFQMVLVPEFHMTLAKMNETSLYVGRTPLETLMQAI